MALVGLMVLLVPATGRQQEVERGLMRLAASGIDQLRETDALVERLIDAGDLRLRVVENDTLVPGRVHERYAQYYKDVPVVGAEVIRQVSGGLTLSVFGSLYRGLDLDVTPALSAADIGAALVDRTDGTLMGPPELMVLALDDAGEYRLVYRARASSSAGPREYFMDARNGEVVRELSLLQTQDAVLPCTQCAVGEARGVVGDQKKISVRQSGGRFRTRDELRPADIRTYDMNGDFSRTRDVIDGTVPLFETDLGNDVDNLWTEGGGIAATVDAHVGAGWTYDYLYRRFGRRSLNDRDGPIVSLVHPVRRADLFNVPQDLVGLFFLNAFYCGACGPDGVGVIVYGEGLPPGFVLAGSRQTVDYFSGSLDIVVHELTHGVTGFSSRLVYMNESGALNEAFSDIIATGGEFFYQTPGPGRGQADYLIGEDVIRPGGIRSLANPRVFGDPDHYSVRFTGTADQGGVHTNSLIAGHAFYLAIEGGRHQTSGRQVLGVGSANRAQIERVFYRAFVFLLSPNATFRDARLATIQAARDVYPGNAAVERAITEAWSAVGVE